jgi:hypothetical protein
MAWSGHGNWAADRGCMPRLVRGRRSHGSTAAFTGDLRQIHPQRKPQSQPHEESAEPKHTSCYSGDSASPTGNPVIFAGNSAHCGITQSMPDVQSLRGKTHSKGQPRLTSDMPSLFHSPRTQKSTRPHGTKPKNYANQEPKSKPENFKNWRASGGRCASACCASLGSCPRRKTPHMVRKSSQHLSGPSVAWWLAHLAQRC